MRKIPTLYKRDESRRFVTDEVNPGCEWALAGEGVPTRKIDGTCVRLDEVGNWWARREVKPGKAAPDGFVEVEHDEATGKTVGWEPIEQSPFVKFWAEAVGTGGYARSFTAGTYELVGPKINGNPERWSAHELIPHSYSGLVLLPDDYSGRAPRDLIDLARRNNWEGIVWHHPDGRMVKLKVRDYPPAGANG